MNQSTKLIVPPMALTEAQVLSFFRILKYSKCPVQIVLLFTTFELFSTCSIS